MDKSQPNPPKRAFPQGDPVKRVPAGDPVPYRGYTLVPMRETFKSVAGPNERIRWDVHTRARPTPDNRVKICASRVTAEGWVDTYGEPSDE